MMTTELFTQMCAAHDLTYMYSDDGSVWRRGQLQYDAIQRAAKQLGPSAVEIWNAEVTKAIGANHREQFLWKPAGELPKLA